MKRNPVVLPGNYRTYCEAVAAAYDKLPAMQPKEAWRWRLLAEHVDRFYKRINRKVKIKFVRGHPYKDVRQMRRLVRETGVLKISLEDNEHPVFKPMQNMRFRAVHDYVVHILPGDRGPDFSRRGEIRGYNLHRRLAPPDTWPALFTEVAAQACYHSTRGVFPEQKVAVLPFDYYNVGLDEKGQPIVHQNPGHVPSLEPLVEYGEGEFEDYYPKSAAGEMDVEHTDLFYGRNVIWRGDEGRMVRVDPEYATHMSGNIFDADKLASIVSGIDQASERVVFDAPYGQMTKLDLNQVKESLEYQDDSENVAYTTGDEELDRYLVDPSEVLDEYADDEDEAEERAEHKAAFDAQLQEAVDDDDGDLGAWVANIRDGNHRAFGSMLAGEPYIFMYLYDNDYQDLKASAAKGTLRGDQQELWEMLV